MNNYAGTLDTAGKALKEYKWYESYSLPIELQCTVCRLQFALNSTTTLVAEEEKNKAGYNTTTIETPPQYGDKEHLFVTVNIVSNNVPVITAPVATQLGYRVKSGEYVIWDYVLTLPIRIRDLSDNAIITFTVWYVDDTNLYDKYNVLIFREHSYYSL